MLIDSRTFVLWKYVEIISLITIVMIIITIIIISLAVLCGDNLVSCPNFEEVDGTYCFWIVCPSVRLYLYL